MKGRRVLVVDDDDAGRNEIVEFLRAQEADVVGVGCGEEALRLVESDPQRFQFAVIDHFLGEGMDGIKTTKELVDRNGSLFVLVFTRVPSDSLEEIAKFKYQALCAGAYRYMERGGPDDAPKQVADFVAEIEQLIELSEWIRDFYEDRGNMPSLLRQLDIGVDVIDRSHKVWFMNEPMRRITGLGDQELPRFPCSHWHGYTFFPCPGCLVHEAFVTGQSYDRNFLSPLCNRDKNALFYLRVWTQPVRDHAEQVVLAPDGLPLAVMESVQELTNTAQLVAMPFQERLDIIATALHERPVGGYLPRKHFQRVKIYTWDQARPDMFVLKAAKGFPTAPALDAPVDLSAIPRLSTAEQNVLHRRLGTFFHEPGRMDPHCPGLPGERFIYWPIIQDERTVGLIEASGDDCNEDSVLLIKPYAKEVAVAVHGAQHAAATLSADVECGLANIGLKLQTVGSPEEALRLLVSEACTLTDSHLAVIRYREGDDAVLLRLGLAELGGYERVAEPTYPLSHGASWSARTIVSGQEHLADMIRNGDVIKRFRQKLCPEAKEVLQDVKALCFEPLVLEGRCIGALGLHARDPKNYSDPKLRIARAIARWTALALHDYLVDQEARKQVEQTQSETIGLLLHNINTPLANIRTAVDILSARLNAQGTTKPPLQDQIDLMKAQIERIAGVRREFLNLTRPWESRVLEVDLHDLIRETVLDCLGERPDVSLHFELPSELERVQVDALAVGECLRVLVQNSLDALEHMASKGTIQIVLRIAEPEEARHLASSNRGLAIDVLDNGPGVPSDIRKGLFRIIRSGKAKGLGFGLTYCKRVATSSRGDVYYEDQGEAGAEFTLVLPFRGSNLTAEKSQ